MWVFYHDITTSTQSSPNSVTGFVGLTLLTALIVLAPTYFDKNRK